MKKIIKIIIAIVGLIYSISQIFDVYMKYKSNINGLISKVKEFDFVLIGQLLLIIGFAVFTSLIIAFLIKRIFKINRPRRDALDYFVENLLPEEQLTNSEPKHRKKLKKYNIINLGLHIIILGILIIVGAKLFGSKNDDKIVENIAFELDSSLINSFHRDDRLRPDNPDFEFYVTKSFVIDLNGNEIIDTIFLKKLKGWENDPGDFQQIEIITDNGLSWTATNFDGWVRFDNNYYVPDSVKRLNQLDTDLLLLTDFENTKILGLFGWVYAIESGLLTIIDFSTKQPRIMINKNLDLVGIDNQKITIQDSEDKCWIENINNRLIMTCE